MDDPVTFRGLPVAGFGHPRSELRRRLVDLVLAGTKTATAGLLVEYQLEGAPLPSPGQREAILDAQDRFVGELETTECRVLRMADVDDRFARDEGEGFAGAAEWATAHERFWGGYLHEIREGLGDREWSLTDDTLIVCQRFRLAERYPQPIPLEPPAGRSG